MSLLCVHTADQLSRTRDASEHSVELKSFLQAQKQSHRVIAVQGDV